MVEPEPAYGMPDGMDRYQRSQHLFAYAGSFVGDARNDLDTAYPFFLKRGKGPYVWDLDGHRYIDFTNSNGAIVLGHAFEEVDNAVVARLREGNVFATQFSEEKVIAARLLLDIFPGAGRAIFFKTGSDAADAAVRIARVATGRDLILTSGYHGWHDWQLGMFPRFRFRDERHINFRYDLDLLARLVESRWREIAGVIITPDYNYFDRAFFIELQCILKNRDLLFILDEVASGFRYCLGGLQAKLGLDPDITCLGKGLANGYSVAAVVGKDELLREACLKTHMWSTYNSEMSGLVAATRTLEIMISQNVPVRVEAQATRFADGLRALSAEFGIRGEILTHPNIFHIVFEDDDFLGRWVLECARHGVLLSKDFENMLSLAHDSEVVDEALGRIRTAFDALARRRELPPPAADKRLSRRAIEPRVAEEFDANFEYTIYRDRE
jgi:glutamate-1-semialdehyde aminotransferase